MLPSSTAALAVAIPAALSAVFVAPCAEWASACLILAAVVAWTPLLPLSAPRRALLALASVVYAGGLLPNSASLASDARSATAPIAEASRGLVRIEGVITRVDPAGSSNTASGALVDDAGQAVELRIEGETPTIRVRERWSILARRMESRGLCNFDRPPTNFALPRVLCNAASMQRIRSTNLLFHAIADLRALFTQRIDQLFPSEQRGLTQALLLGHSRAIESAQRERLRATGTAHLIAVSGAHVMLFLALPYVLLRGARRWWRIGALGLLVVAYTLLTGAESPVRRAALLVAAQLACEAWNRPHRGFHALCWAAVIELMLAPRQILELSFLLSYLAVAGLLIGLLRAPAPSSWSQRLNSSLRMGLGATAATLPLLHHQFGTFSPHTLWLSPVGSPLLAISMALGYGAVALPSAALAWCAAQPLAAFDLLLCCADGLAGTPIGMSDTPLFGSLSLSVGVLAALAGYRRLALLALFASVAIFSSTLLLRSLEPTFAERPLAFIEVLDVGHGTCVLIGDDRGRTVLFDAGSRHAPRAAARALAARLAQHGTREITALVLSHRDEDHRNLMHCGEALPEPRIRIGPVGCPEVDHELVSGSIHLALGTISIRVHAPTSSPSFAANDGSLWMEIIVGAQRFLLFGDPDWLGLAEIIPDLQHGCEALLWPHHGRTQIGARALIERTAPRRIWISDEQPHPMDLGTSTPPVFDTARCGALLWTLARDGSTQWSQARPAHAISRRGAPRD